MQKQYVKRKYKHWSDEDLDCVRQGIVPPGRTLTQCQSVAFRMGISFRHSRSNRWTEEDIKLLRQGKIPEGRTACAAKGYCMSHHIPVTGDIKGTPSKSKRIMSHYTKEELDLLANNKVPPGWPMTRCYYVSRTVLGKGFRPTRKSRTERLAKKFRLILEMRNQGLTDDIIAKRFKVTRQCITQYVQNCYETIGRYVCAKLSIPEIIEKYNISSSELQ